VDKIVWAGKLAQESWIGQPGQESQEKTVGIVHPGQETEDKTARRTARTGQLG
jgi:hypothetical protein